MPSGALRTLSRCHFVSDVAVRVEPGAERGGCVNGQMEGGEVKREKWTASRGALEQSRTWKLLDFRCSVGIMKWSRFGHGI